MNRLFSLCVGMVCVLALAGMVQAKTMKLAMDADPVSLDPQVQLSGGMLQYSHMVFDPLIRWTQDMEFEPRLAKSWERLDETTVRFHLRDDVTFHSGNSFTAEDVAWTIDRLKRSQDFKGLFEPFVGAEVVDSHTVDVITKKPYPLVLNMATYIFPMDSEFYSGTDEEGEPKDAIVKTGYSFANTHESGTGKYMVTEREQGVEIVFEEYEDYWDDESPGNIDKIVFTPIKKDSTRVAALLSGDVDFIMPVPPQDYKRISNTEGIKLATLPGSRIITLQLNQERRPEFQNRKVRQAIVHAVNNEGIADKIMKGKATAAGQQAPEGYQGYVEELTPRYDLQKAKELMAEAGYKDGFECTMIAPNNRYVNDEKIAEATVSMLGRIGIEVNLKTMPKAQYWDQFDDQVADIQMIGWHPDTEDSANYTEFLLMCPDKETGYGQYNSGNYCSSKVDELIMKCQSETDQDKRTDMLQEVERILYEDAAFVPLHWQHLSWAGKESLDIKPIVNVMNFPYFGDLVME
ncbi:MAG: ABC transporter substrate-binding protein [Thermodesulfobacteriota bacterium]